MKIINDTLKSKGEWSQKRITTMTSFYFAVIYAFIPVFIETFEVKEFVFIGFLGMGGFSIYRTQKTNENAPTTIDKPNEDKL